MDTPPTMRQESSATDHRRPAAVQANPIAFVSSWVRMLLAVRTEVNVRQGRRPLPAYACRYCSSDLVSRTSPDANKKMAKTPRNCSVLSFA